MAKHALLRRIACGLLPALLGCAPLLAQEAPSVQETREAQGTPTHSMFRDPEDGQFDASEWLLDHKGFLPLPIIITEPAVGTGFGLAALFFRQSMRESAQQAQGGRVSPPDIFGVGAFKTENGTEGGALGGMFSFDNDRWRYRGGVGKADVHLDFYGAGRALDGGERKIAYSLKGMFSSQQVLRRLGESNHFLALRWIYVDLDSRFDPERPRPRLPDKSFASRNSGLGLAWEYDSRDNIFTPSKGLLSNLDAMFYTPGLGSDNSFRAFRGHLYSYFPLGKSLVLGLRGDARAARGEVPFYQLPFIDMRGIPAGRYQDRNIALIEAELRWNVTRRWALVGFAGTGRAWGEEKSFKNASAPVSKGVGARYLLARRLGLFVGLDYAWGPEDRTFYIQVGSAWR